MSPISPADAPPLVPGVPTTPATDDAPRRRFLRFDVVDTLVLAGTLSHVLLPFVLVHIPYQDITNHIARYVLLERAWFGVPAPWIRVEMVPSPYLAVDVLGVGLIHLVGPHGTGRVLAVLTLSALPIGLYWLLRAVAPAQRIWALVGALLSGCVFFTNGMLNYQLGVGAALVWLGAWWTRREQATLVGRAGLVLGIMMLYLIHLSVAVVALVIIGADLTIHVLSSLPRTTTVRAAINRHRARIATSASCLVGIAFLLWLTTRATPDIGSGAAVIVFRTLEGKLRALATPFHGLSPWSKPITLSGYVVAWATFVWMHRTTRALSGFGAGIVALAGLYVITPLSIRGEAWLDLRWLLPLYLVVFAAFPESTVRAPRAVGPLLLTACLVHVGLMLNVGRKIDSELNDFDAVLASLPRSARVLSVVGGGHRYPSVEPNLHYALWHTIKTGSRVGGLFSYMQQPAGKALLVSIHFAHFREINPPYSLDVSWRNLGAPALPWAEIRDGYDVVIQAGRDPELSAMLAKEGCLTQERGGITVFALDRPCSHRAHPGSDGSSAAAGVGDGAR